MKYSYIQRSGTIDCVPFIVVGSSTSSDSKNLHYDSVWIAVDCIMSSCLS